jgi:hypothetical protein
MGMSAEQSVVLSEVPVKQPVTLDKKYWAEDLTWQPVPKFTLTCDTIGETETLTVPATYQYIIGGALINNGTIVNDGKVVLI